MAKSLGYDSWVAGRSAYDIDKANDFDYWITGPYDLKKLDLLFDDFYRHAYYNVSLYLDMKWVSTTNVVSYDNNIIKNDALMIQANPFQTGEYSIDFSSKPFYSKISENLVMINQINKDISKPHHIEHLKQYKKFLVVPAETLIG